MKVIILGDFGGMFSQSLFNAVKNEKADLILGTGDYADIKPIARLFLKYGHKYEEYITPKMHHDVRKEQYYSGIRVLSMLNKLGTPVKLILGNNDFRKSTEFKKYISKCKNLEHIHDKLSVFKGLRVFGWSNLEHSYHNLREDVKVHGKYLDKRLPKHPYIFLTHLPPWNTKLDVNLNKKFNYKKHVGSKVVNHVLWHHRPEIILCGHLEEHTGECRKRGVRVINPGAAALNQYAVMQFDGDYEKAKIEYVKAAGKRVSRARLSVSAQWD
ncbi:MAG: metallophosphoesterase [Candidatus Woesearchaeota archaeon]